MHTEVTPQRQEQVIIEVKSYFDGTLLQFIGWNLLGVIVTVCTFGICYPWAVCMIYGWKINHTVVEGRSFSSMERPLDYSVTGSMVAPNTYHFWDL